jgi:hypothetical protein
LLFGDNCPMIALHIALDGLAELALAEVTRALSRGQCALHVRLDQGVALMGLHRMLAESACRKMGQRRFTTS